MSDHRDRTGPPHGRQPAAGARAHAGRAVPQQPSPPCWSTACFLIALVPLLWILWTRPQQGRRACSPTRTGGPTPSAASPPAGSAAAPTTRSSGRLLMAFLTARDQRADRASGRPSTWWSTDGGRFARAVELHGRRAHRRALDRRGVVHLRALGHDLRVRPGRLRRLAGPGAADDPGGRPVHRGDAPAGTPRLREASYALGVPRWKTIMRIVVPTAFSGIITGVMLGLARVMGETAPLLILGPYTKLDQHQPVRRHTWPRCRR